MYHIVWPFTVCPTRVSTKASSCLCFSEWWDESLNIVSHWGQARLLVGLESAETKEAYKGWFTSKFLDHAAASDLLNAFTSALDAGCLTNATDINGWS